MRPLAHPLALLLAAATLCPAGAAFAQGPPLDLWIPRQAEIRDTSTLNLQVVPQDGYADVFFDSETNAKWGDSEPPYAVHTGATIRIHGYLAAPATGGPYPALVVGHGHGGHGDADLARVLAAFGYVVLSIDGPMAGLSTGGPRDTEQAWISVEEEVNVPSPEVGFLFHYAYAGMRALTALQALAQVPGNPYRVDPDRLGVMGASMGGQFTYYINGVDDRVKAAVALAVAGEWGHTVTYAGAWLYHGLYYYTRDGIPSGTDALNAITDVCLDPTMNTFLDYFDPGRYAPSQHAPLLTIIGSHDQYFVLPAINATYDKMASAGTNPRFIKRILITPDEKHGVVGDSGLAPILYVLFDALNWLHYCFNDGPLPLETPQVGMVPFDGWMLFVATAASGDTPISGAELRYATQLDSRGTPCDFGTVPLTRYGDVFLGLLPPGSTPPCGPAATPANVLYYALISDAGLNVFSSTAMYGTSQMEFCSDLVPAIEHFPRDDFPVQPPPAASCFCPARAEG
jgi:dienelactone hydrolase